jgi:hypothetical protein
VIGKHIAYMVLPLVLCACNEPPQTLGTNSRTDKPAFDGTGVAPPYTAAGWKNGDKGAWEQQLKVRTQMGQNDYNKVP